MTTKPVLEPAAQRFADATANPPYLADLGPEKARETVDQVQSGDIAKPDVDVTDTTVPGGPSGEVSIRILRPREATGPLPVIVYIHGGGWVFGNAHTHDRLIRELAVGAARSSGTADGVKRELRGQRAAEDVPNWFDSPLGHEPFGHVQAWLNNSFH